MNRETSISRGMQTLALVAFLFASIVHAPRVIANDNDVDNEYRLTLLPYYPFSKELVGFGYLGFVPNWDKEYTNYYMGVGGTYDVTSWMQTWLGLIGSYTDGWESADKFEVRPFVGAKFFVPNDLGWNIYAFPRYEYRMVENLDTDDWSYVNRVRLRLGLEIPLTERANAFKENSWYGIVDVEPMYRFDTNSIDPLRLRAGLGYVIGGGKRVEFIYHAQWTRPSNGGLDYTDNIFRINFKFPIGNGPLAALTRNLDIDD
jgi:hypothetical protein